MGTGFFDQYSLLHCAVGIVLYFWNITFSQMLLLNTVFEIVENTGVGITFINSYIPNWPGGKRYSDSYRNIFGDTVSVIFGWWIASQLDQLGSQKGWYRANIKK